MLGLNFRAAWRSGLWWLTATVAGVEIVVGGFLAVDAVIAASLGVIAGSLILLAFGGPAGRPSPAQVVAALQECGVDLVS